MLIVILNVGTIRNYSVSRTNEQSDTTCRIWAKEPMFQWRTGQTVSIQSLHNRHEHLDTTL